MAVSRGDLVLYPLPDGQLMVRHVREDVTEQIRVNSRDHAYEVWLWSANETLRFYEESEDRLSDDERREWATLKEVIDG